MSKLYQLLNFDAALFVKKNDNTDWKMQFINDGKPNKYDPKTLLLNLYQIVQYIDENVALKSELRIPADGGGGVENPERIVENLKNPENIAENLNVTLKDNLTNVSIVRFHKFE